MSCGTLVPKGQNLGREMAAEVVYEVRKFVQIVSSPRLAGSSFAGELQELSDLGFAPGAELGRWAKSPGDTTVYSGSRVHPGIPRSGVQWDPGYMETESTAVPGICWGPEYTELTVS